MSERFTPPAHDIDDLVTVGKNGTTFHRPDGKFLSVHEKEMIAAHADQIRTGEQIRHVADFVDSIDDPTDPAAIRQALRDNGVLTYKQAYEMNNADLRALVSSAKAEKTAQQQASQSFELPPVPEGVVEYTVPMPATRSFEPTPLVDTSALEAKMGAPSAEGAASAEPTPLVDTSALEAKRTRSAATEADTQDESPETSRRKHYRERMKSIFNGQLLTEASLRWSMRHHRGDRDTTERNRRARRIVAVGAVAATVAGVFLATKYGIDGFREPADAASDVTAGAAPSPEAATTMPPKAGVQLGEHLSATDIDAFRIPKGSGGEALMDRLGANKDVWYQHQNEFLQQFPDEAYRMSDGNAGFDDPGKLSKKAIKFWATKTGRWQS